MSKLTHISGDGEAHMVDVGDKAESVRTAVATAAIIMKPETLELAISGNSKKGDVVSVSRIAGIMAAKKTSELIPLCHPIGLDKVSVDIQADNSLPGFAITSLARVTGKTGVEMEALTACSVTCLTLYDMLKAVDRTMVITELSLKEKTGGKSDDFLRND